MYTPSFRLVPVSSPGGVYVVLVRSIPDAIPSSSFWTGIDFPDVAGPRIFKARLASPLKRRRPGRGPLQARNRPRRRPHEEKGRWRRTPRPHRRAKRREWIKKFRNCAKLQNRVGRSVRKKVSLTILTCGFIFSKLQRTNVCAHLFLALTLFGVTPRHDC